eukprot:jgi/Orpsp1_1/1177048/evm.model.c7180000059993.1
MNQYIIIGILILVVRLIEVVVLGFLVAIGMGMTDQNENDKGWGALFLYIWPYIFIYLVEIFCYALFVSYIHKFCKIKDNLDSELPITNESTNHKNETPNENENDITVAIEN